VARHDNTMCLNYQNVQEDNEQLFGSLGVLQYIHPACLADLGKVLLSLYNLGLSLRGSLKSDAVAVSTLFWLSVRYLPLTRSCVYIVSRFEPPHQTVEFDPESSTADRDPGTLYRFNPLSDLITGAQYVVWLRQRAVTCSDCVYAKSCRWTLLIHLKFDM